MTASVLCHVPKETPPATYDVVLEGLSLDELIYLRGSLSDCGDFRSAAARIGPRLRDAVLQLDVAVPGLFEKMRAKYVSA